MTATPLLRHSVRWSGRPNTSSFEPSHHRHGSHAQTVPPNVESSVEDREALAQRAVDVAHEAGAQYADARLTNTITHRYWFGSTGVRDVEEVGIGVRALVNGSWGFAACPSATTADVDGLAHEAVAQAIIGAQGAVSRHVEFGTVPPAVGQWTTPVSIDPFTVSIEEKHAFLKYWQECASNAGVTIDVLSSFLVFTKQERVVATSDGGRFTQTIISSGGQVVVMPSTIGGVDTNLQLIIRGIEIAGAGWELFLNADIPAQLQAAPDRFRELDALHRATKQATVGRYTLVCDGATMASLLGMTLGIATQADRALGYEANAGGTTFLDDPMAMLGTFKVSAPSVTVTANRSAQGQLATVKWDDEGVAPAETTLIKDGILVDYQTTREQAAWLAPYYSKTGRAVRSNGCAAAESALEITMQHMPNLTLETGDSSVRTDDLIANVSNGVFIERGTAYQINSQARGGMLAAVATGSMMRKIQNGKLGPPLANAAIRFNTLDLWKNITALGGQSTQAITPFALDFYSGPMIHLLASTGFPGIPPVKGEPAQSTNHSVQAVAATIANQPLIDPGRKA